MLQKKERRRVVAACVQMKNRNRMPEVNLSKAEQLVNDAASEGAEIVVLPEYMRAGWIMSEEFWQYAEPSQNGPTQLLLSRLAKKHNLYLGCTFLEATVEGHFFNTFVLHGPSGDELGRFRKRHAQFLEPYFICLDDPNDGGTTKQSVSSYPCSQTKSVFWGIVTGALYYVLSVMCAVILAFLAAIIFGLKYLRARSPTPKKDRRKINWETGNHHRPEPNLFITCCLKLWKYLCTPLSSGTASERKRSQRVIETPLGRIGVAIGIEMFRSSVMRELRQAHVDLLLIPSSWYLPLRTTTPPEIRKRMQRQILGIGSRVAQLLGVPTVYSNKTGACSMVFPELPIHLYSAFSGASSVSDKRGNILDQAMQSECVVVSAVKLAQNENHFQRTETAILRNKNKHEEKEKEKEAIDQRERYQLFVIDTPWYWKVWFLASIAKQLYKWNPRRKAKALEIALRATDNVRDNLHSTARQQTSKTCSLRRPCGICNDCLAEAQWHSFVKGYFHKSVNEQDFILTVLVISCFTLACSLLVGYLI
jgi:predicted amidohydrolase